ncbi:hypothetical protein NECID01_1886 [Nematocida sp. AWRm77]|nr:hypothetical protein NECID01_1886 [Nematocida sp. AWRm77]
MKAKILWTVLVCGVKLVQGAPILEAMKTTFTRTAKGTFRSLARGKRDLGERPNRQQVDGIGVSGKDAIPEKEEEDREVFEKIREAYTAYTNRGSFYLIKTLLFNQKEFGGLLDGVEIERVLRTVGELCEHERPQNKEGFFCFLVLLNMFTVQNVAELKKKQMLGSFFRDSPKDTWRTPEDGRSMGKKSEENGHIKREGCGKTMNGREGQKEMGTGKKQSTDREALFNFYIWKVFELVEHKRSFYGEYIPVQVFVWDALHGGYCSVIDHVRSDLLHLKNSIIKPNEENSLFCQIGEIIKNINSLDSTIRSYYKETQTFLKKEYLINTMDVSMKEELFLYYGKVKVYGGYIENLLSIIETSIQEIAQHKKEKNRSDIKKWYGEFSWRLERDVKQMPIFKKLILKKFRMAKTRKASTNKSFKISSLQSLLQ